MVGPNSDIAFSSIDIHQLTKFWFHNKERPNDCWAANRADKNPWIQVTFPSTKNVTGVAIAPRRCCTKLVTKYTIEYSKDGIKWIQYNNG